MGFPTVTVNPLSDVVAATDIFYRLGMRVIIEGILGVSIHTLSAILGLFGERK